MEATLDIDGRPRVLGLILDGQFVAGLLVKQIHVGFFGEVGFDFLRVKINKKRRVRLDLGV